MTKPGILVVLLMVGCGDNGGSGADVEVCLEGETKSIEGQPACDSGPPAAGSCECVDGQWACSSSCHMDCPDTFGPSTEGTLCSFDEHDACTYMNIDPQYELPMQALCSCVNGMLSCDCGGAPCEFCTDGETRSAQGATCDQGTTIATSSTCVDGGWVFVDPCHWLCPAAYDSTVVGSSCSFTKEQGFCSYSSNGTQLPVVCNCVDGKLDCQTQ